MVEELANQATEGLGNTITLTGTGFDDQVTLFSDGFAASLLEVSEDGTQIKFLVTQVNDQATPQFQAFCGDGLPVGYDTNVEQSRQYLGHQFHGISPVIGFKGGTLITIYTSGIGKDTDISQAKLAYTVGSDRIDFCFPLVWNDEGQLTCRHDSSSYP